MFRSLLLAATFLTVPPLIGPPVGGPPVGDSPVGGPFAGGPLGAMPPGFGAAQAQGVAGPYLAARIAGFSNDYRAAGDYYEELLRASEATAQVQENAIIIFSVLGDFDAAAEAAEALDGEGQASQFAANARMVVALRDGDTATARAQLEGEGVGGALLDGLLGAWIDAQAGETTKALAAFDAMAETESFAPFAWEHKAFLLAQAGDFEGADDILSGRAHGPLNANTRIITAHAQILMQLDREDDALELLTQANDAANSPMLQDMQERIEAGDAIPYDAIATPKDGMAEAYFTLAALLSGESSTTFTLLNARAATVLRPGHVDALVLTAELLESQAQHDLAGAALSKVPQSDPAFFGAEIARAEVLLASGRDDAAVEVLLALTRSHGDRQEVWAAYADVLRRLERFEAAAAAYDTAIDMISELDERDWYLVYARGIARERLGDWPGAEADFRQALALNPEQPNVLNNLGYGLVEQRLKLDEALSMIEQAVAARADDGYITDSLGWALYRLGRYDEAIAPMEEAVELEPMDPLINDHLGDVLWVVGRKREAEFQWKRALSLDPEEQVERIERKLEVGLDVVLEEEGGAGPTRAAGN